MTAQTRLILSLVDEHLVLFLLLGSAAMVFNYIYFAGAAMAARRDRVYTYPLVCTTLWFAHDLSFVLMYAQWFDVIDHWYVKLFWVALIPTTLAEAGYLYQTWLYGQTENLPGSSKVAWTAYVLAAVVAGGIAWWSLKQFLADEIFAYTFGATGNMAPALVLARVLRRGDAKGQSVLTWVAYVLMQCGWFGAVLTVFGPDFRTAPYVAMVASSVLGGVILAWVVHRKRTASPPARVAHTISLQGASN